MNIDELLLIKKKLINELIIAKCRLKHNHPNSNIYRKAQARIDFINRILAI